MIVDPAVLRAAADRGDDLYPYAEYRPIPEATTQPVILPWLFMLHTMAGPGSTTPDQLWRYINRGDINGEPHLILGYTTLIQALPFTIRADNNAKANSWWVDKQRVGAVSVETQDNGSNVDPAIEHTPWNAYQIEHLAGITAFLHLRYGIPFRRCADWDSRGVDGHRAHPEWSIYTGKTCPGQTRWEQIPTILSLASALLADTQPPGDTDMSYLAKVHSTDTAALHVTGAVVYWLPTGEALAAAEQIASNDRNSMRILTDSEMAGMVFVGQQPSYPKDAVAGPIRCRADMFGAQG